jgi:hypothetical protein
MSKLTAAIEKVEKATGHVAIFARVLRDGNVVVTTSKRLVDAVREAEQSGAIVRAVKFRDRKTCILASNTPKSSKRLKARGWKKY